MNAPLSPKQIEYWPLTLLKAAFATLSVPCNTCIFRPWANVPPAPIDGLRVKDEISLTIPQLPYASDADVVEWLRVNSLPGRPAVLPFQDEGYLPRYCHISAKHHSILHGGRRIHGWALWRFTDAGGDTIVIAEHHSVWERSDGILFDITPPVSGGKAILFLRDDTAVISKDGRDYLVRTDRTNFSDMPRMFRGQPVPDEFWRLHVDDMSEQSQYASSLGFDWADFPTAQNLG